VPVVQGYEKAGVRKYFRDHALHFQQFFLGHDGLLIGERG
jgi:hypothetical protein